MSRSHGIKGETTDKAIQEQFFCWREELLLALALGFGPFKFQALLHAKEPIQHAEGKEKGKITIS